MTPLATSSLDLLLEEILEDLWSFPVRLMEAVLDRGEEAVEPVIAGLRRALDDPEERLCALWPTVLLGELGSPAAVPALVDVIRRRASEEIHLPDAAAEALAKIGPPAVGELASLIETGGTRSRLWAYAALGWIRDGGAYGLLADALDADRELADVVATALGCHGNPEAIPLLYEALREAEAWQRPELEDAIRRLHLDHPGERPQESDWRLRYRVVPALGGIPPSWAGITAIVRDDETFRDRAASPLRPLEEILAEPWDGERGEFEPCECCGVPRFRATGVPVCPATALGLALLQREMLGDVREEESIDDLFDVLEVAEDEAWALNEEPEPRSRKAQELREDRLTAASILRGACVWLIENGIESVGGGRAALLAEASVLRDLYGDPEGFFTTPDAPAVAPDGPGRNDPCPCGSGRKYKKCCGHPAPRAEGRAGSKRGRVREGEGEGLAPREEEVPDRFPRLVTFDGEPLSPSRAHYRMADAAAVREALARSPDLDEGPAGDSFVWLREVDEEEARVLGQVELEGDRLTLECLSEERLARGKRLLEELAGEWLAHRGDTTQDPWQAVLDARRRPSRAGRKARDDEALPPEVEAEVIGRVLDRHYRRWPDERVRALDGRTPRAAARDPEGRREVADLLRHMEEMEAGSPPHRRYDFGWLWSELGIEELR